MNPEPSPQNLQAEHPLCARHPSNLATFTCTRCGRFACAGCKEWNAQDPRTCTDCARLSATQVRAEPGQRFLAAFLDGLVLLVGLVPVMLAVAFVPKEDELMTTVAMIGWLISLGAVLLVQLNLARRGQSIGKRWQRIRVVRSDGSKASVLRIVLLRNVVPQVIGSFCGIFAFIDPLFIFGAQRRCLHDLIADTIVITEPSWKEELP